jgi:hypothetical protein
VTGVDCARDFATEVWDKVSNVVRDEAMKIERTYFERLLAGEVDGPILDLGQLASFWCTRARMSEQGELEGLSRTETTVQLLLVYIGEVGNGGHIQFFLNSSGDQTHETLSALCDLGETGLSDALRHATAVFAPASQKTGRSESKLWTH